MTKRRRRTQSDDALVLSFVDVICCGMGATTILVIVFFAMPHLGAFGLVARAADAGAPKARPVLITVSGIEGEFMAGGERLVLTQIGSNYGYILLPEGVPANGMSFFGADGDDQSRVGATSRIDELQSDVDLYRLLTELVKASAQSDEVEAFLEKYSYPSISRDFGYSDDRFWSAGVHKEDHDDVLDLVTYRLSSPSVVTKHVCRLAEQPGSDVESEIFSTSSRVRNVISIGFSEYCGNEDCWGGVEIEYLGDEQPTERTPEGFGEWEGFRGWSRGYRATPLFSCRIHEYELESRLGLEEGGVNADLEVLNNDEGPQFLFAAAQSHVEFWRFDAARGKLRMVLSVDLEERCKSLGKATQRISSYLYRYREREQVLVRFNCTGEIYDWDEETIGVEDLWRYAGRLREIQVYILGGAPEATYWFGGQSTSSSTPMFTVLPSGVVEPGQGWELQ